MLVLLSTRVSIACCALSTIRPISQSPKRLPFACGGRWWTLVRLAMGFGLRFGLRRCFILCLVLLANSPDPSLLSCGDSLMGDPDAFSGKVSGNLPWRPLLVNHQLAHPPHQQRIFSAVGCASLAPLLCLGLSTPRMAVPPLSAVAFELSGNSRFSFANNFGNYFSRRFCLE